MVMEGYESVGYPGYLLYLNGSAKLLGVIALLTKGVPAFLKEWAYAGFFYVLVLALVAHIVAADGMFGGVVIALVLWLGSYVTYRKVAK